MAGLPLRCRKARVRGGVGLPYVHDAPEGQGAEGRAGPREGAQKAGQENQTLIASFTLRGAMCESLSIEGATDAELFEAYVERLLAPSLSEGQVVVLDGL